MNWNDFFKGILAIDDRFSFDVKWKNKTGFRVEIAWLLVYCGALELNNDTLTFEGVHPRVVSHICGHGCKHEKYELSDEHLEEVKNAIKCFLTKIRDIS
jgi:hypothetical protein